MQRIRFYSDDSYSPNGRPKLFHTVVAGVAISADRTNIRQALIEAERLSKKKLTDWRTTPADYRERYLEAILQISGLHGRIFYRAYDSIAMGDHGGARVETLRGAISKFTPGDCHHEMYHEGLQSKPRHLLRKELRERGCERVTVETAQFIMDPEVRLSDAIAGYVRAELYRGHGQRAPLTNLPDWFIELGA